jgi:hypothetical protein
MQQKAEVDQVEFEFPDEREERETNERAKAKDQEKFVQTKVEIEDDTPPEDRGREPLPKEIVQELENDELEDYSDKVRIKLKQLKKVWNDERREKEQALREQQEALAAAQRMLEENRSLKARLSKGEQTFLDTYKTAAELEMDAAKRSYKEAYDSGDTDKLLEAQQKLSEVQYKLQRVREYTPSLQQPENEVQDQQQIQVSRPDPRAAAWQERNTWFGQDEEMTSLALGLHQKLVKQYGDAYPSTDEYWQKVDDTMRRRFPDYFGSNTDSTPAEKSAETQRKPSTVVAPATRSTSSKKIVLKQSQLNIAKKLGLSPEQYAREIMKMEANNG